MKILVIGNGGREHALVWKLAQDRSRPEIFCAPGNAGTLQHSVNLAIGAEDVAGLVDWAKKNRPDLTVVGPEAPLCAGIVDLLAAEKLSVFGPSKAAAQLEGSKVFSKDVMVAAGVPTASARAFTDPAAALAHVRGQNGPLVVKASGLAAGKGVIICKGARDAEKAVQQIMVDKAFGAAGAELIVEDFLEGEEASILALVDGERVVMLASAQDHKRVFNNDEGPNTGGMGAYSPAPVVTDALWPVIRAEVFERTLAELRRRGIVYRGILYAGLMIGPAGPKVLEFNCRFGDPETQAVLPRIDGDLLPALQACAQGGLSDDPLRWKPEACVCVVMASGGYPDRYEKDKVIDGLDEAAQLKNVIVFHAGTARRDEHVVTAGGRVLGVTALGRDVAAAARNAYRAILRIRFDQAQYRSDIGARAMRRPA